MLSDFPKPKKCSPLERINMKRNLSSHVIKDNQSGKQKDKRKSSLDFRAIGHRANEGKCEDRGGCDTRWHAGRPRPLPLTSGPLCSSRSGQETLQQSVTSPSAPTPACGFHVSLSVESGTFYYPLYS